MTGKFVPTVLLNSMTIESRTRQGEASLLFA